MVEFKVSEDESYFFVKTIGDYPLLIAQTTKRLGKPSDKIFKGNFLKAATDLIEEIPESNIYQTIDPFTKYSDYGDWRKQICQKFQ